MSDQDPNLSMLVGEMKGQLRELIHSINGISMKVDGLGKEMGPISNHCAEVPDIKRRIAELEADRDRRAGALNLFQAVTNSKLATLLLGAGIAIGGLIGYERVVDHPATVQQPARMPMGGTP